MGRSLSKILYRDLYDACVGSVHVKNFPAPYIYVSSQLSFSRIVHYTDGLAQAASLKSKCYQLQGSDKRQRGSKDDHPRFAIHFFDIRRAYFFCRGTILNGNRD